ncbi:MAG: FMN-binding protein, partial [Solobacterium sp.]|nr:FMN-binding protein [Solobacterium sp.]
MKKFGKLMLSAMLACSLFGCTQKAGGAKDGEFSASEKGFGGDIKVTLKVSGGKVEDVTIDASKETPDKGGAAAEQLAKEIKEKQSPNVDAVSGSTISSEAIIKAAKSAFEQAGLKVEETTAKKGEDETVDTDVLVVGMGASGTLAALTASEAGAKVIGVEATDVLGGFGNAAQGMFAIGTDLQ